MLNFGGHVHSWPEGVPIYLLRMWVTVHDTVAEQHTEALWYSQQKGCIS